MNSKNIFNRIISLMLSLLVMFNIICAKDYILAHTELPSYQTWMNSFHSGGTSSGVIFNYDGDNIHSQNGATFTVEKDSGNSGNGFVKQYTGDKLTYHSVGSAGRSDSGILFLFDSGTNDVGGMVEYVEFNLSADSVTHCYASIDGYNLQWADQVTNLTNNKLHKVRVEIDRCEESLNSGIVAVRRVYLDSVLMHKSEYTTDITVLNIWIAAYSSLNITMSDLSFGVSLPVTDSSDSQKWINTFHPGGTSEGVAFNYDGDNIHSQNGATFTVEKDSGNSGNGYVKQYTGDKLTYHSVGSAGRSDSGILFLFDRGANNVGGMVEYVEFNLSADSVSHCYAVIDGYNLQWADQITNMINNKLHKVRVEIDRCEESLNSGIVAVRRVYLDSVLMHKSEYTTDITVLNIWIAAYSSLNITMSDLSFGVYSPFSEYMATLTEISTVSETVDALNDISSSSSLAGGSFSSQNVAWSIQNDPKPSIAGDKAIYCQPSVADNSARILGQNPWCSPICELSWDMYMPSSLGAVNINIKMDTGWISDRISILADGNFFAGGSGGSYGKQIDTDKWHNIKILYDGKAGMLWFLLDNAVVYKAAYDNAYEFLNYIEILCSAPDYYIDNLRRVNYDRYILDGTSGIKASFSSPDGETLKADCLVETDGKEIEFLLIGAIYENVTRLSHIKITSVKIARGVTSTYVPVELGSIDGGTTVNIMCFDNFKNLAPVFPKIERDMANIFEDEGVALYENYESEDIGTSVYGGTVCSGANGSHVLRIPLTQAGTELKYEAFCLGDFVVSFDIAADAAIKGQFNVYGGGTPAYLVYFDESKNIKLSDGTILSQYSAAMKKITVVFKHENKSFDFYIDGVLALQGYYLSGITFDKCVDIGFSIASASGSCNAYIDNLIVYSANTFTSKCFYYDRNSIPIETDKEIVLNSTTTIPSDSQYAAMISGKVSLHMRSGVMYANGSKRLLTKMPYYKENEYMVPVEFFESAFGISVNQSGNRITIGSGITINTSDSSMSVSGVWYALSVLPETKDGVLYLPLRAVAEKGLGKHVTYDDTAIHYGMVIVSDSAFTIPQNVQGLNDYCFYLRPTKEMLLATYSASPLAGKHPRLMATQADFDRIKNEIRTNSIKAGWYRNLIAYCDEILNAPTIKYELQDGVRLMYVSGACMTYMLSLGMAYKLTGERKYFESAWRHLEVIANMPDWNPSHHIDVGIMALGYAIAYDWFYDEFTPEQRVIMEKGAYNNCLWTVNEAVKNDKTPYGHVMMSNNHNVFTNAGNMAVCLAFMDIYPVECSKIGSDIFRMLEAFLDKFAPDGQYYEGADYATVAIDYLVRLYSVIQPSIGLMGLDTIQGFNLTGDYLTFMQSDVASFNFADTEPTLVNTTGLFWMYKNYGIKGGVKDALASGTWKSATDAMATLCLLWYDVADEVTDNTQQKLDAYYPSEEIITSRNTYNAGQVFVGIKGGKTLYAHSHYDVGSFVYDAMGRRWAHDLGKEDYNLEYAYGRFNLFRNRAESHNVLLINPDTSPGLESDTRADVIEYSTSAGGMKAVLDMTEVYGNRVASAKRGFLFTDNRQSLVVRDEVTLSGESELYWLMYINSNYDIQPDGSVILTSSTDMSKKVRVEFVSSVPGTVGVEKAQPFLPSMRYAQQNQNTGYNRLYYKVYTSGNVSITAKITPVGCEASNISSYNTSITNWQLQ